MRQKKEFLVEGLKKMQRLAGIKTEEVTEETPKIQKEQAEIVSESETIESTKFDKRNRNLFENIDRIKKLSGLISEDDKDN